MGRWAEEHTYTLGRRGSHLEELHPNAGKHELQQGGDYHNVANGFDGHEHALDHMLQQKRTKN